MDKYYRWKVLGVVILIAASLWQIYPPQKKIKLGLDLKGGMHLLLKVETDKIPEAGRKDAVDRALEVIRNRIDQFGVSEPSIQKQGVNYIVVQLPGVTDRKRALDIIGKTALLEFKLVSADPKLQEEALKGTIPEGYELKELKEEKRREDLLLEKEAVLTGDRLVNAGVSFDQTGFGQPVVTLEFDRDGAKQFARVTESAVAKFRQDGIPRRLAIVLDGEVRSAPQMKVIIADGRAQIEGNFNYEEASDLALVLRAGALPAPVKVEEDRIVGPSLGKDSIEQGTKACLISGALVALFMAGYYLFSGVVAGIALFLMLLFTMGALVAFGATLSLPGIAGLVLNIGMSVDANVLIFERMREELNTGKTVRSAISAGYHKAFSAILDSNVTTLITALILFYFGSGPIKGFAVTLSIGIVASMITAIIVTRLIFDGMTREGKNVSLKMFNILKEVPKIDFIKRRFWGYGLSIVVIGIGLFSFFGRGSSNYGVDFVGGVLEQIRFNQTVDLGSVRSSLEAKGVTNINLQNFGEADRHEVIFRSAVAQPEKIHEALDELVGKDNYEVLRQETVGPAAGAEIRSKAIKAFFIAMIGCIIYMTWRFDSRYAICAIIAEFHDAFVCIGAVALSGREFSISVISAILTIIGYSLNDTIVIYDRVRENVKLMRKLSFRDVVNLSVNQTLSRSILTNMTVLIVVAVLYFFGGDVINDFAFTMLIGCLSGTYSTIFCASPILVDWKGSRK
ncbi:MAG TPA: protein translocase subunit SecD [Candidatus Omnitrophota bacterium]|nr:protein translocase subunit SecD [Candidatus Omnitrophota bacterium]